MSASKIVQGTPRHAFTAERQRYRVKSLRTQALRVFHRPTQLIRADLRTDSSGEARELCKLHLKQQLVGVNRGIFGIKVRRLHISLAASEGHFFILCKHCGPKVTVHRQFI